MRGQFSPQNTSTGADSRPKMPGKAHRMAIYKNRKMVSDPVCSRMFCGHCGRGLLRGRVRFSEVARDRASISLRHGNILSEHLL